MKKIVLGVLTSIPFLGLALQSQATSTQITLPPVGDLIGTIADWASPFITAFWPIIGMLIAIGVVFFIIGKLTNRF